MIKLTDMKGRSSHVTHSNIS